MSTTSRKIKVTVLLTVALLFIFTGLSFYNVFYPLTVQYAVENKIMILKNGSKFYEQWSDLKVPTKTEIYLFELVNGRDFLLGKKPRLVEHGPFVFNHYKKKMNIAFNDDGTKVSYKEIGIYHFDRANSVADLNDYNITVVNLALIATMNTLWKQTQSGLMSILSPLLNTFVKEILDSNFESLIERRTPGQLLIGRRARFLDRIEGYLSAARRIGFNVGKPLDKNIGFLQFTNNSVSKTVLIRTGKRPFEELVDEFVHHNWANWWVRSFAKVFGYATFETGDSRIKADLERLDRELDRNALKVDSFGGKRYFGKSLKPGCNEIKGTDGTLNNNYFVNEQKSLFLHADICRPLKLDFERKKYYGLVNYANQYTIDNATFVSRRENWCFCPGVTVERQRGRNDKLSCTVVRRTGSRTCRLVSPKNETVFYKVKGDLNKCNGLHDLSTCNEVLPVAITFPHFLHSPTLQMKVDGLSPEYQHHRSYLNIDPTFGVTLEGKVKLQVNVRVHPAASSDVYSKFKPTLMPYIWMIESAKMSPETQSTISSALALISVGYAVCLIPVFIGVAILLWLFNSSRHREGVSEFVNLDSSKKTHSANSDQDNIWNHKELIKSKLRKSKKLIDRKTHSSTSLNQILPSYGSNDSSSPELILGSGNERFEKRKSISLKSERLHSNQAIAIDSANINLPPLVG